MRFSLRTVSVPTFTVHGTRPRPGGRSPPHSLKACAAGFPRHCVACRQPPTRVSLDAGRGFCVARPEDKPFDQAVCVHGHRAGDVRNIGSAREAAEWLLCEWPTETIDSFKARAARRACLNALEGVVETADARDALCVAAEEAGMLIGDGSTSNVQEREAEKIAASFWKAAPEFFRNIRPLARFDARSWGPLNSCDPIRPSQWGRSPPRSRRHLRGGLISRNSLASKRDFAQIPRMLARAPLTEIEVEDIGTVRLPNMWQQMSLKRVRAPNREIARFAAAACMSIKQFKRLPAEKQQEIRWAYLRLMSPTNI
jgi:hypothetical protein